MVEKDSGSERRTWKLGLSLKPLALPTPTSRNFGHTYTAMLHIDLNMTSTHRIPGEHGQATHTSTKHMCTPLATQAHRHRCRKRHLLLLGF